jgi:DNA-binding transcriptional regulator YiaG
MLSTIQNKNTLLKVMSKSVEASLNALFLLSKENNTFSFLRKIIDEYDEKLEAQELAEDEKWLDENLEAIKKEETFSYEEVMKDVFNNNIKSVRIKLKISQSELAKRLNKTSAEISRWESGAVTPTLKNYRLISEALECSLEDLLD